MLRKRKNFFITIFLLTLAIALVACEQTHTHNYVDIVTVPTCLEKGFTTHTCECGDSYVDNYVNSLGHNFDASIVSNVTEKTHETCTTDRVIIVKCKDCSETEEQVVEKTATGHNFDASIVSNVTEKTHETCTTDRVIIVKCRDCSETEEQIVKETATGHNFDVSIVSNVTEKTHETCTTDRVIIVKCRDCSETEEQVVEETATGHNEVMDNAISNICQQGKTEGRHCENCGTVFVFQQILPAIHNVTEGYCTDCNEVFLATYVNVDGATHINPEMYYSSGYDRHLLPAEKTGYVFEGWYSDENFTNKITFIAGDTSGPINIYAKWKVIVYTATFVANDEVIDIVEFTVEEEFIDEPEITPIDGFTGKWEDYTLGMADITIHAIYMNEDGFMPIFNAKQLKQISSDGNYILMNDLDLKNTVWDPIDVFSGIFDGNNHCISNSYKGIFLSNSGTIKNLSIKNFSCTTYYCVGESSLVSVNRGVIKNCSAEGIINIESHGSACYRATVGGLVTVNLGGLVEDCYFSGTIDGLVSGYGEHQITIGGLVGKMEGGEIRRCYTTGYIRGVASYNGTGETRIGGLVGYAIEDAVISECYSESVVMGCVGKCDRWKMRVGGLVGHNGTDCLILNCYSTGSVSYAHYTDDLTSMGALVGFNWGTIEQCYAIGEAIQENGVSFVGSNNRIGILNKGSVSNSFMFSYSENFYYLSPTTSLDGIPVDLSVLKSYIFQKEVLLFDENIWILTEGEFPKLKNNNR